MSKLEDLYQEILLEHVNRPRRRAELDDDEVDAEAHNPLCGDRVRMAVDLANDQISGVRFDGEGCAICMASASIAASQASGKARAAGEALCERMIRVCREEENLTDEDDDELAAVAGVRRFPMRVKCATLPWHALQDALAKKARSGNQ